MVRSSAQCGSNKRIRRARGVQGRLEHTRRPMELASCTGRQDEAMIVASQRHHPCASSEQRTPPASKRRRCTLGAVEAGAPIIGPPPPKKSLSGRQFTGKNSPRPAAARAGRIFTGKLSAEGDFSGGDPVTGRDCLWDGQYFDKRKTYQFCDCLSTDGFFMGQTF